MHGMTGAVSDISGNAFTLSTTQGLTGSSLMTHSGTHFSDLTGMHMMTGNMLVSVDATLQPDGTWIVDHVQSQMGAGGAMAAGVVTGIVGNPPTQLTLVMHDGVGTGMMSSSLAGTTTVNLGSTTQFAIDTDGVDLSGLPFTPRFDLTHKITDDHIPFFPEGQFIGRRAGELLRLWATGADIPPDMLATTTGQQPASKPGKAEQAAKTLIDAANNAVDETELRMLLTAIANGETVNG